MIITDNAHIASPDERYVFGVSDVKRWSYSLSSSGSCEVGDATFSYGEAMDAARKDKPKSFLEVNTPVVMVFQGLYGKDIPDELLLDDYVGLVTDIDYLCDGNKEILATELDFALKNAIGMDAINSSILQKHVMARATLSDVKSYDPDIAEKVRLYNGLVSKHDELFGHREIIDGKLIPSYVEKMVNEAAEGVLPKDSTFKERWDYFMKDETSRNVFNDKLLGKLNDAQFEANTKALAPLSEWAEGIRINYGMTENESALLNGIRVQKAMYTSMNARSKIMDMISMDSILDPSKIADLIKETEEAYSGIRL